MSKEPPEDTWDDVIDQVEIALDQLNIGVDGSKKELLDGVREALNTIGAFSDVVDIEVAPDVTVVEGGRDEGAPPTDGDKPDLHVAPVDDDETEDAPKAAEHAREVAPSRVQVVRLGETLLPATSLKDDGRGKIVVAPDTNGESQQTVYRGETAATYRIHVAKGPLGIVIDGQPGDMLQSGQSGDFQGKQLQVSSAGILARGSFHRVDVRD